MKTTLKRANFLVSVAAFTAIIICTGYANAKTLNVDNQPTSFAVDFTDCVESIGVTLVPTASARLYVPHQFILAGEGQPVTPPGRADSAMQQHRRCWSRANGRRDGPNRSRHCST